MANLNQRIEALEARAGFGDCVCEPKRPIVVWPGQRTPEKKCNQCGGLRDVLHVRYAAEPTKEAPTSDNPLQRI